MMAVTYAVVLGVLVASGVYLMLRARTFPVVLGLTLLGYAVTVVDPSGHRSAWPAGGPQPADPTAPWAG